MIGLHYNLCVIFSLYLILTLNDLEHTLFKV